MATETVIPKYANPQQECDLVMKGGITSGLVYPPAIQELAEKYRIRNIGGTSAGAVAAALAAAAEYARDNQGFERLGTVADELKRGSFLRNLFQGSKETEPLLKVLVKAGQYKKELKALIARAKKWGLALGVAALGGWLYRVFEDSGISTRAGRLTGFLTGVAVALVLAALIWALAMLFGGATPDLFIYPAAVLGLVCGIASYWLGGLAAGAGTFLDLVAKKVPQNLFGICSGKRDNGNTGYTQVAATEWLLDCVQRIAGRHTGQDYLTFEDLSRKERHKIDLRFMTTDISAGRPYVLPFDEWFIFSQEQLGKLFPGAVVEYLSRNARVVQGLALPAGYCFLPPMGKWPIAVAARLSMSFPFLFSSVPLYRLPRNVERLFNVKAGDKAAARSAAREEEQFMGALSRDGYMQPDGRLRALVPADLVPHWFSDGGIASNFPIHFFDAWMPDRPTLGITLRYVPSELVNQGDGDPQRSAAERAYLSTLGERCLAITALIRDGQDGDVWLPVADESVPDEWQPIYDPAGPPTLGSAFQFIWSIVKTMQNYRDNMQTALESYRERVVQVRLNPNEGGLNLDMSSPQMDSVVTKGVRAGTLLRDHFALRHHEWARLRVLVSRLEEAFRTLDRPSAPGNLRQLIADQRAADSGFPFAKNDSAWCAELDARTAALLAFATSWKERLEQFESGSSLRVTPEP